MQLKPGDKIEDVTRYATRLTDLDEVAKFSKPMTQNLIEQCAMKAWVENEAARKRNAESFEFATAYAEATQLSLSFIRNPQETHEETWK